MLDQDKRLKIEAMIHMGMSYDRISEIFGVSRNMVQRLADALPFRRKHAPLPVSAPLIGGTKPRQSSWHNNPERLRVIIREIANKTPWSLIASDHGVTRNTIAGISHRWKQGRYDYALPEDLKAFDPSQGQARVSLVEDTGSDPGWRKDAIVG